jgi:dolichol-phosphate mannosyltransferase
MYKAINIVVPVYNEGDNIFALLTQLEARVQTPYSVHIVYDFDEDMTLPVVQRMMKTRPNITLLKNKYGRGVLNALRTGLETLDGVILVVMADLSDDLAKIDQMFTRVNEGYDVVCGSRYMKGGKHLGGPRLKAFLSRMAGWSLHCLAGIPTHDITNSFKMYKKQVINDVELESNGGFEIGMEIVVKAYFKGYKVTEVPSEWRDRTAGESKFKLREWVPKYLHWYFFALKTRMKCLLSL